MYFTKNDLLKIEQWLKQRAVKDSDLEKALALSGKELIPIILNNKNVTIPVDEMFNALTTNKDNVINISALYDSTFTFEEAIQMVKDINRKEGLIITFIDKEHKWKIYQFVGESIVNWSDKSNWRDLFAESKNHFKGFFTSKSSLLKECPNPEVGDFAYVGVYFSSSVIFRCITRKEWIATEERPLGSNVTQETGLSLTLVVSLKLLTDELNKIWNHITNLISSKENIEIQ